MNALERWEDFSDRPWNMVGVLRLQQEYQLNSKAWSHFPNYLMVPDEIGVTRVGATMPTEKTS
jgi:hypothetical protein